MKRNFFALLPFVLTVFCLIFPSINALAVQVNSAAFDVGLGYRSDDLNWSIAGDTNGANPNVMSELSWTDLEILQLNLAGQLEIAYQRFANFSTLLKARFAFGESFSGKNQDSDYNGDNRTQEWSRSYADTEAQTIDFSAACGVKYLFEGSGFSLAPMIGYSYSRQNFRDTNGVQVISDPDIVQAIFGPGAMATATGPFPGLDSTYKARWNGPWVGMDAGYSFGENFHLNGSFEYHWAYYLGNADWNLRSDFQHPLSFQQNADGKGVLFNIEAEYAVAERWSLLLSGNYQDWKTDHGSDRTFLVSGSTGITRLNEVNWESYALMTGVRYRF